MVGVIGREYTAPVEHRWANHFFQRGGTGCSVPWCASGLESFKRVRLAVVIGLIISPSDLNRQEVNGLAILLAQTLKDGCTIPFLYGRLLASAVVGQLIPVQGGLFLPT